MTQNVMQDHLSTVADKNCRLVCFAFIFFPYLLSWTFSSYEYIAGLIQNKQLVT